MRMITVAAAAALLAGILVGCGGPGGGGTESAERVAFSQAMNEFLQARAAGFDLDAPGAGRGPEENPDLASKHARQFYMPMQGRSLVREDVRPFLARIVEHSSKPLEVTFARKVLAVIDSPSATPAETIYRLSATDSEGREVFAAGFVIYYYD